MSGRRGGNNIRGPQSALTSFLAANNISAAQIRDNFERRRQSEQQATSGAPSTASTSNTASNAPSPAAAAERDPADVAEEEERTKKRKRTQKNAIEKVKKSKAAYNKAAAKKKQKKKYGSDDDDDFDLADEMYTKSRPAPGQLEYCDICNKRFTVTPYNKEGPDGGLLCTPCGKELKKDLQKEHRATAKPAGKKRRKMESDRLDGIASGGAKSLTQLCIEKIAVHHDEVEELGDIPQPVLERLSMIFSKKRVMKSRTLRLFLRGDLEDVVVHDAAYLEPEDYHQIFAIVPKMKRLVLGNACQMKDEAIDYMLGRCQNLQYLQLYAANLVTDGMWHRLFRELGTKLQVIKLKWLDASFDDFVVQDMIRCCPSLTRVKFELCRRLDQGAVAALTKLENLLHLSLQIGRDVPSSALCDLIETRGPSLRTLSLKKFIDADDTVLDAIRNTCQNLTKLRISDNDTATDAGYTSLFTSWSNQPLTFIDLSSTRDVDNNNPCGPDEAIGLASDGFRALMTHSGSSLRHLDVASCRHITLGAFMDVFNGAKSYPSLEHINISFCNSVDTSVVAGIFKSCPALKKLVAFGCFNVQDVVVPRNIALIGVPTAQDAIEQFGVGIGVEEAIIRMIEVGA